MTMPLLGATGIGLAWGWLLAPLLATRVQGWMWAGTTATLQGLVVAWLAGVESVVAFGIGLAVGAFVHAAWRARLRREAQPRT